MAIQMNRIVRAGLALMAAAVVAVPAAAAPSAADAVATAGADDHTSFTPGVIAQARRMFLDALASETSDIDSLSRMLPRAAEPVAALIGAAPAGRARAEALLQRLGLDPARFLAGSSAATGGPFIAANDPQVRDLQADARRRATLAASFAHIPAFLPVARPEKSSDFGYRRDPFRGRAAFHAGLDLTGSTGDAIHAAADGVVVRAGWWAGYGKVVVIDHGNGIETRYGHMSRFHVKAGDRIRQGQVVGGMGSTGRSTGTHLHFEIRLDGRPLDPQPFLDLASYGLNAPPAARPVVIAPVTIAQNEPFAPLADNDMVTAGGRVWTVRAGR